MLSSKLLCSFIKNVPKSFLISSARFQSKTLSFNRKLHLTAPTQGIYELQTYDDMENYFAQPSSSLAVFDFHDSSNGLSKMQSSRIRSKIDCADLEIDLIKIDVVSSVELADYFQIDTIPTLISFVHTEMFERIDGNLDDEELDSVVHGLVEEAYREQ